jgi:hypothetical protein
MGDRGIEMFQIKKKNKKISIPSPSTMARGFVALQHPRPHGGAVVHDGPTVGAGVLQPDEKKKKNKNYYFLFFIFGFLLACPC